jgi:hypothetical protein
VGDGRQETGDRRLRRAWPEGADERLSYLERWVGRHDALDDLEGDASVESAGGTFVPEQAVRDGDIITAQTWK